MQAKLEPLVLWIFLQDSAKYNLKSKKSFYILNELLMNL